MNWYKKRKTRGSEEGYTLLELLVVMAILALLVGLAVPQVIGYLDRAKVDAAKLQINSLSTALDLYRLDVGDYPSQEQGLNALISPPADAERWNGPYLTKVASLTDPWGNPYRYRLPGRNGAYDLSSLGADGAEGGDGDDADIGNWE